MKKDFLLHLYFNFINIPPNNKEVSAEQKLFFYNISRNYITIKNHEVNKSKITFPFKNDILIQNCLQSY